MKSKIIFILLLIIIGSHTQQLISQIDFVLGATYTGSTFYNNFVGVSVYYENIENYMNLTLFQDYFLNMNVLGNWYNNWAVSVKVPLGHKYNCSALQANTTTNVTCLFQTEDNTTYWQVLGSFVWNTMNAPYWCMGYDMQGVNLTNTAHQDTFYDWLYRTYVQTNYYTYCAQLVDYGDKMVQRGYKASYSPTDFINDIDMANYIVYIIGHSGPGITQDATKNWLTALQSFAQVAYYGHYTVRCVVFKNPSDMTIQKILSDNSTKYYLQSRFTVNSTYGYTDFGQTPLGINDIRLTTGEGVDGLTNSFAAALWALDITLQFVLMNGWEIDFNFEVREGNFQSILGPGPDFKPSALYYGLMFAVLVGDGFPEVIIPSMKSYISSKIKVFGFTNGQTFKLLLINKDTNATLNGTVLVKSQLTQNMRCMYMQAPSLTSTDGITIAGYNFVGGNATVNGTYKNIKIKYDVGAQGYNIPIKYAQAVLCQTADSQFKWPTSTKKNNGNNGQYLKAMLFSILIILGFLMF